jgi:hypothetical protein
MFRRKPKVPRPPADVLGAWGYASGLEPPLLDTDKYKSLLTILADWNDVSPTAPGVIAAAVVFRSPARGVFFLGSSTGECITVGPLAGTKPRFDNRWIGDRGKDWLVQVINQHAAPEIEVSQDPQAADTLNRIGSFLDRLMIGPTVHKGIIRNPLVLPILTQFFDMKLVR